MGVNKVIQQAEMHRRLQQLLGFRTRLSTCTVCTLLVQLLLCATTHGNYPSLPIQGRYMSDDYTYGYRLFYCGNRLVIILQNFAVARYYFAELHEFFTSQVFECLVASITQRCTIWLWYQLRRLVTPVTLLCGVKVQEMISLVNGYYQTACYQATHHWVLHCTPHMSKGKQDCFDKEILLLSKGCIAALYLMRIMSIILNWCGSIQEPLSMVQKVYKIIVVKYVYITQDIFFSNVRYWWFICENNKSVSDLYAI